LTGNSWIANYDSIKIVSVFDSLDQPNVATAQIHLVLNPDEFATIVMALRAVELHGFADRLDVILCQGGP
jgi:hypothetical protein